MSVIFDQLRISDDGNRLYINVHVNTAPDFDNVYLDSIKIVLADKVLETDPNTPSSDYIYYKQFEGNNKVSGLVIVPSTDPAWTWAAPTVEHPNPCAPCRSKAELSRGLFFVYVKTKGTPGPCVPCRLDEEYTLGAVFDENLLHQRVMGYTKELVEDCNIPQGFIDFILLWNAFKSAIETEHFIPAVKYYNMLFDGSVPAFSSSGKGGCGCRG